MVFLWENVRVPLLWFGLVALLVAGRFLLLANPRTLVGPFQWLATAGALVFFQGLCAAYDIAGEGGNSAPMWIALTVTGTIPLGALGLAVENLFMIFLCIAGGASMALRLALWITDAVVPANLETPMLCLIFVIFVLLGIAVGYKVNEQQKDIQEVITKGYYKVDNAVLACYIKAKSSDEPKSLEESDIEAARDYQAPNPDDETANNNNESPVIIDGTPGSPAEPSDTEMPKVAVTDGIMS
uniref:Uncharacterized protein n=1 Tax=Entomoneis paludosa TaxID=265537 RepID=A0A7S3DUX0_9STRA